MHTETRAILDAYRLVAESGWPGLHPGMGERAARWPTASEGELKAELQGYLDESDRSGQGVRVFWKLGPDFIFQGANQRFAQDAGMTVARLMGLDDFDASLPWRKQAAKYRSDDRVVMGGRASLDIVERHESETGEVVWVRVGKAPIQSDAHGIVGVFGMYEILSADEGRRLFTERLARDRTSGG